MDRRRFLYSCVMTLSAMTMKASGLAQMPALSSGRKNQAVRFAIISDIHQDIMPDAEERLKKFLMAATRARVDFIIDLGDFCFVKKENRYISNLFNSFQGEKYHALGNHDMDNCTKMEYMQFVGMKERYYSFDRGDFRFIVLDPNHLYVDGKYIPYQHGNYYIDSKKRAFIDPAQLEWLERTVNNSSKRCILFSHQSLENTVGNREEVRAILEKANQQAGYRKVVAAFSGHDHTNYERVIHGITYIQINSASNQWVGGKYQTTARYDAQTNETHPSVRYTTPYIDPLYAIVDLEEDEMRLKGVESAFMAPTPEELQIPPDLHAVPLVAYIRDFVMRM